MKNKTTLNLTQIENEKESQNAQSILNNELKKFVKDYVSEFEFKIQKNYERLNEDLKQRLAEAEKKLENHEVKLKSVQDEAQINQNKIDKINDLSFASKKNSDQILANEIRLNSLQKEFSNACYKYDRIFLDNLYIPGTIGDFCTYKNMRDYVETSISQVQSLLSYKDKNTAEFKAYKEKFENLYVGISSQLENSENNMKTFTSLKLKEAESNFKRECENLSSKINDLRMENNKYAIELKKNASELNNEKENVMAVKETISKQIEELKNKSKEDYFENNGYLMEDNLKAQQNAKSFRFQSPDFNRNLNPQSFKIENRKLMASNSSKKYFSNDNIILNTIVNQKESDSNNNGVNNINYKREVSASDRNKMVFNKTENAKVQSYLKDYIKGGPSKLSLKKEKSDSGYFDPNAFNKKQFNEERKNSIFKIHAKKEEEILKRKESIESTDSLIFYDKKDDNSDSKVKRNLLNNQAISEFTDKNNNEIQKDVNFINTDQQKNTSLNPNTNSNEEGFTAEVDDYFLPDDNLNSPGNLKINNPSTENFAVSIESTVVSPSKFYKNKFVNDTPFKSSSRFIEKFPNASRQPSSKTKEKRIRYSWSLEKAEKEDLIKKESISNQLLKIISTADLNLNSGIESNADVYKVLAKILNEFNELFFSFKRELLKKFLNTEQRIILLDHLTKKKFEELSNQIKKHLPITFNAYIRDLKDKVPNMGCPLNANIGNLKVDKLIVNKNVITWDDPKDKNKIRDSQVNFVKKNIIPDKNSFKNFYLRNFVNFSKSNNIDIRRESSSKK